MRIHLWGTDFRRGTHELRKKLYLPLEGRREALGRIAATGFKDLVYLATCNRIEFFTTAADPFCDTRPLWIGALKELGIGEEAFYQGYHLEGKSAFRHLLRVASSLESMVIGEPQILGQLKDALRWSKENGLPVDSSLERAFQLAFETAKRVRSETSICDRPVSVATLGLQYLQSHEQIFGLSRAVVVGRSPINLAVIQWLLKNRLNCPILWVNRTVETLKSFPESEKVQLMSLQDFLKQPIDFSHLFTATSSAEPLFDLSFFEKVGNSRKLVFDFAEPADVSDVGQACPHVTLIKMEDLQAEARVNAEFRSQAVGEAENIVESALRDYCLQQKQAPLLRDFNAVEPKFLEELQKALAVIQADFPPEAQDRLKRWAESLVRKNLHASREHLREVLKKVTEPTNEETSYPIF
jgi:glutamyl-tRNA reductase